MSEEQKTEDIEVEGEAVEEAKAEENEQAGEQPSTTDHRDDDRTPLTFDEFRDKGLQAVVHVRDNIFVPFRRTIRSAFEALTSGADAAADELAGKKKKGDQ